MKRNKNFFELADNYLFQEVARRKREYQAANPTATVISLGVGNTTEPLPACIASAMARYSKGLSTVEGYSGYGDDCGNMKLRTAIAKTFYSDIDATEVFISDGAKCDIARLQSLFGGDVAVAVQDPSYPVYVDGSIIMGAKNNITYMSCTADNDFFPNVCGVKDGSLIYICSPNNPTGSVATKAQLKTLVDYANKHGCIIIFDAAYSMFIRDETLPKTIYEVAGAKSCAIEVNSFSKPAGFTGVRLGWSVVPKGLVYDCSSSVNADWVRVQTTLFNCASNIAQAGGLAALTDEGLSEMKGVIDYYLENAALIQKALNSSMWRDKIERVYYTGNSPYLWVRFKTLKSWEAFDLLLKEYNIVTTPGSGFGYCGEYYLRFSAFGHRADIDAACKRLSHE